MPEAVRDDGTCRHGRIDADAIIYEGWLIRFDASEGKNNTSFYNCRQLQSGFFRGTGEEENVYVVTPKYGKKQ